MNEYITGQIIELTATFDVGVPTDPTTVAVKYAVRPAGGATPAASTTTLTYTGATTPAVGVIARIGAGVYEAQVDTTGMVSGLLTYEWVSTGTAQTVGAATVQIAAAAY